MNMAKKKKIKTNANRKCQIPAETTGDSKYMILLKSTSQASKVCEET